MVIDGSEVLDNPNGSAPGLFIEHAGAAVALLRVHRVRCVRCLRTLSAAADREGRNRTRGTGEFCGGGVWRIGGG